MSAATTTDAVKTGEVTGRRKVRYADYDEVVADCEQLSAGYRRLGNWTLGQVAKHLAVALEAGLDGSSIKVMWPIRFVASRILKPKVIRGPMKAGFKLPKGAAAVLEPPQLSDEAGIEALRVAARRWKTEPQRHPHAFFGPLTPDEWNRIMLNHAEMHMSFVLPK